MVFMHHYEKQYIKTNTLKQPRIILKLHLAPRETIISSNDLRRFTLHITRQRNKFGHKKTYIINLKLPSYNRSTSKNYSCRKSECSPD